ncbi:MAG: hypothetical protein LW724_13260 [Planctomycetaceae bacterium]|nr:hypothetical protein [Planctomycetaceae bacterium]
MVAVSYTSTDNKSKHREVNQAVSFACFTIRLPVIAATAARASRIGHDCSWLGNSPQVAQQSYLLVTEDDFATAAGVKKVMDP